MIRAQGRWGNFLSEKQSEEERGGEDTDVSHQERLHRFTLMALPRLIGSQDSSHSVALEWSFSAHCT